jgi:hydrogenase maturation protein HypF
MRGHGLCSPKCAPVGCLMRPSSKSSTRTKPGGEPIPAPAQDRPLGSRAHDGTVAAKAYEVARSSSGKILAVGGELKASVCLYHGREALLSDPVGDLTDPRTYRQYIDLIRQFTKEHDFNTDAIAHDLHPLYMSTQFARGLGLPMIAVQHHHAHVVSVMVDSVVAGPVVGVCADGVGYGSDGAAWGCEVMACDASGFERLAHLEYFPMFGGDVAAIQTWRPAAALLKQALGEQWRKLMPASFDRVPESDLEAFDRITSGKVNLPMTSSLGRVFDAVSCMLGLCYQNEREAQAAIALEAACSSEPVEAYPYETTTSTTSFTMSLAPMVRAIVKDLRAKKDVSTMAARFHETIARMLAASAMMACEMSGVSTTVLSGGCFANRRLLSRMSERLRERGLTVVQARRVSCGDAGLALGQAVAAAAMRERAGVCAWQCPEK